MGLAQVANPPPLAQPANSPAPLIIGIEGYDPPFIMQTTNNHLYGYDISMMLSLCKALHRTCQFRIMNWIDILPAIMKNEIDLAASSITITAERSKFITFSLPYLVSYSRFLTLNSMSIKEPFTLSQLDGKRIGVFEGTIYQEHILHMGIKDPKVVIYKDYNDGLKALSNNETDCILFDNPSAVYWAANSSGAFKVIGKPIAYGFGFGIAVSSKNKDLLPLLNDALLKYMESPDFKENYRHFIETF